VHPFNEHHPELKGFSAFYQYAILPTLKAQEEKRLSRIEEMRKWRPLLAVILVPVSFLVLFIIGAPFWTYVISGVLVIFSVMTAAVRGVDYIKFQTKTKILDEICEFLGCAYQRTFAISPHIDVCKEMGLLTGNYDFERLSDRVAGQAHGMNFEFFQLSLEKRKENSLSPIQFQGRLLMIQTRRGSTAKTVVLQDKGRFNPKAKAGMKSVGFADPEFEGLFEAYSTDQVEARHLLTPDFMVRLINLEKIVKGQKLRFGFLNESLLIVIETSKKIDIGDMKTPITDTSHTQIILDEFSAIYDVIDAITKPMRL